MTELKARIYVVAPPKALNNGGTLYELVTDSGARIVTFSNRCADAVNTHLQQDLIFDVDDSDATRDPRVVTLKTATGETLYDKNAGSAWRQGGGGGGGGGGAPRKEWVDTTPQENARRAVGCAIALVTNRDSALIKAGGGGLSDEDMEKQIAWFSVVCHNVIKDLASKG